VSNRHWDGEHGFVYLPPDKPTGCAATINGRVAHIANPVCTGYYADARVPLHRFVASVLELLLPNPMVLAPALPFFGRATVTEQHGRRMVHLLAYVPERHGDRVDMIELPFELRDGYIHTTVPHMSGHAMVVFEE
jgi:hypothetical protein